MVQRSRCIKHTCLLCKNCADVNRSVCRHGAVLGPRASCVSMYRCLCFACEQVQEQVQDSLRPPRSCPAPHTHRKGAPRTDHVQGVRAGAGLPEAAAGSGLWVRLRALSEESITVSSHCAKPPVAYVFCSFAEAFQKKRHHWEKQSMSHPGRAGASCQPLASCGPSARESPEPPSGWCLGC